MPEVILPLPLPLSSPTPRLGNNTNNSTSDEHIWGTSAETRIPETTTAPRATRTSPRTFSRTRQQADFRSSNSHNTRTNNMGFTLKKALYATALMTAYGITPSQCFGPDSSFRTSAGRSSTTSSSSNKASPTRLFFRSTADSSEIFPAYINTFAKQQTSALLSQQASVSDPPTTSSPTQAAAMPAWLASPRAHLAQRNMGALQSAMRESFFTDNEISKLITAIQQAADGDASKISGAADFCLILVEAMEMGLNALIAAAFHFCACVTAREEHQPLDASSTYELRQHISVSAFGENVLAIERDLASLKRLEVVAGLAQVKRPNSNDAANLRNLFLTESKDWRSLAIRSAACLYRLRGIIESDDYRLTSEAVRVSREAFNVYAPIASRLGMHRLKNELEGAAFRTLYRRQYSKISSFFRRTRETSDSEADIGFYMNQVLHTVQEEMTEMLANNPVFAASVEDFTVTARVKEAYSAWVKMLKVGAKDILDVPDAIALRIVLNAKKKTPDEDPSVTEARERALCYYAQQLCTYCWRPREGDPRFKDYLKHPKPNGYQSLHYTATTQWGGDDWSLEIQIRSGKMHKVAEFGLASHWDYKARSRTNSADDSPSACDVTISEPYLGSSGEYLQSLQEWHWHQQGGAQQGDATMPKPIVSSDMAENQVRADRIRARSQRLAPYIESLTKSQSDLSRDHVFVILSDAHDGKILNLPAGAMVMDAVQSLDHISLDDDVLVNGLPVDMSSPLRNGDILSVPSIFGSPLAA